MDKEKNFLLKNTESPLSLEGLLRADGHSLLINYQTQSAVTIFNSRGEYE